jgi:hypothetical protein
MSAFNRLALPNQERCPRCGSTITRWLQFKYGRTAQDDYKIGDRLRWGANDIGQAGHKRVLVNAYPEACPVCGDVPKYRYELLVEDDKIVSARRVALEGEYERFGHSSFVVLA